MAMTNCPDCNRDISDSAAACPNCGRPNPRASIVTRSVSSLFGLGILFIPFLFSWFTLRKGYSATARIMSFSWLILAIVIVNSPVSPNNGLISKSNTSYAKSNTGQASSSKRLSRAQINAVRSAELYLSISGFSRSGLIQQLSSDFGDGYNRADATIAVDSMNIDWNKQAVRSANQYLSMMGFSCNGLIEQLSSSVGDGYTESQARFGASQAGVC